MTEAEWLACADPKPMLEILEGKASDRKLRLFAVACCRRIWLRWGEPLPTEVTTSELFADSAVSKENMRELLSKLGAMGGVSAAWAANCAEHSVLEDSAQNAARQAVSSALHFVYFLIYEATFSTSTYTGDDEKAAEARDAERKDLPSVLRDIFGNPFRPITVSPTWLTSTVISLAQGIYEERAFDRMPILADALQEASLKLPPKESLYRIRRISP
jgi:hypothetical protein